MVLELEKGASLGEPAADKHRRVRIAPHPPNIKEKKGGHDQSGVQE